MKPTGKIPQLFALMLVAWLACMPDAALAGPLGARPSLVLPDLDGKTRRLSDWSGKVLLVNFWATWCGPCQAEVPNLMRYQDEYGAQGLQIIGVGLDERVKLRNFRDTFELNYPVLVANPDRSLQILEAWGNSRGIVPYSVLLDRQGRVLETVLGVVDDDVMEDLVLPNLDTAPPTITSRR